MMKTKKYEFEVDDEFGNETFSTIEIVKFDDDTNKIVSISLLTDEGIIHHWLPDFYQIMELGKSWKITSSEVFGVRFMGINDMFEDIARNRFSTNAYENYNFDSQVKLYLKQTPEERADYHYKNNHW